MPCLQARMKGKPLLSIDYTTLPSGIKRQGNKAVHEDHGRGNKEGAPRQICFRTPLGFGVPGKRRHQDFRGTRESVQSHQLEGFWEGGFGP